MADESKERALVEEYMQEFCLEAGASVGAPFVQLADTYVQNFHVL